MVNKHMAPSAKRAFPSLHYRIDEPRRRDGQVPREVGKSDHTAEPHRHIPAQMETSNEAPLSDEPLWFTVKGDFLVGNEGVDISD